MPDFVPFRAVRFSPRALTPDGIPDVSAVHHTRVAVRRLRSTLRVFGPLLALALPHWQKKAEEWTAGYNFHAVTWPSDVDAILEPAAA